MDAWYGYLLLGVAGGVFSAMFGVGSGIIMVPALVLLCHMPQKAAQGMSLTVMVPMALVGAVRYRMHPDISIDLVRAALLAGGSVVGVMIGVEVMTKLSGVTLRKAFAVVMVVAAVRMFWMPGPRARAAGAAAPVLTQPPADAGDGVKEGADHADPAE